MASFLLPSWIQKRLLRYALSRLELLDTDALDLEHLEVSWGTRSTLEFRDIGLRLEKLAALLQLPENFDLTKARVLLLRLTIPVDIYSSSIVVEVDGVEGQLKVSSGHQHATTKPRSPTNHERKRKRGGDRSLGLGRSGSAVEARGFYEARKEGEEDEDEGPALPTAVDLAASFLETEPAEERAELEAAFSSQSQVLGSSIAMSDDGEEEISFGTGTPLSLPYFMASFLKGIMDRLQVKVRGIVFNLDVDLPNEMPALPAQTGTDPVTVQISIADVEIEGVTFGGTENPSDVGSRDKLPTKNGKRLIKLNSIRGALISEANLFATLSRSSTMSSPSTTHSNLKDSAKKHEKSHSSTSSSPILQTERLPSLKGSVSTSVSSGKPGSRSSNPQSPSSLTSSIRANYDGRFDDAPEDEEPDELGNHHSIHAASDIGNSVFDDSAYLDEVTKSQYLEDEDLDGSTMAPTSPGRQSASPSSFIKATSPSSTPRASTYLPGSANSPLEPVGPAMQGIRDSSTAQRSTFLPIRSRPRLSESRISRSQPLPPLGSEQVPAFEIPALNRNVESPPESDSADDMSTNSTPMGEEDLAESKIFSHEDAESMYMSALSQASITGRMPGAWDVSSTANYEAPPDAESPMATSIARHESPDNLEHAIRSVESTTEDKFLPGTNIAASAGTLPSSIQSSTVLSPQTPPATFAASEHNTTSTSSAQSNVSSDEGNKILKSLFHLDQVSIYIPSLSDAAEENTEDGVQNAFAESTNLSYSVSPTPPGAFSVSPNAQFRARAPRLEPSSLQSPTRLAMRGPNPVEIILGQLQAQFDVSVARLIAKLISCIASALPSEPPTQSPPGEDKPVKPFALQFRADLISLKFLERLAGLTVASEPRDGGDVWPPSPSFNVLLRATLKGLKINADVSQMASTAAVTLEKFLFGYAKDNIVSFDADPTMRASVPDFATRAGVDLSFDITRSRSSTRCNIYTLPIHISIDLQKLDETFSWFGGLSGVMNMGNSMASNATLTGPVSAAKAVKKTRGVRFEAPIRPDDVSVASQNKANARIGGLVLDLVGKECSIGVDTSAVKVVSREEGIGISLAQIKISGPHLHRSNEDPAILAEVSGTRVEYLSTPKDVDLDRLLSLITPSKAKYDRDDDILLETLLRQRRQGSVLRVTADSFKTQITKLAQLNYLPELGEEVSRLATVAKYLPEDDRPGLLSLVLIRDLDLHLDMNDTLGSFRCRAREIEVAQITLPALVALSFGTVTVHRNGDEEVLGAATDVELREAKNRFPAIMARMIGDEMEPVIRVKLWNLQIHYRVPMIMALLGLSDNASSEDMATSIALSVATLTDRNRAEVLTDEKGKSNVLQPGNLESKLMTVDIAVRDCILALNPLGMPSRVLLVMTEGHLSAVLPKDNNTSATAELSKGSLLVVDNVANLSSPNTGSRIRRQSFDGGSSQVACLCSAGYVSVSYISSAKAIFRASTANDPNDKVVDVELHDDLLVLESCADSTQTLITTLSGLAPPMPPSRELKYRTKVIPVEDLLASLSGDAFGTAEGNYDFDEDFGPGLAHHADDEDDNGELDFNSHYYQDGGGARSYKEGSREGSILFEQVTSGDTNDGVLLESFHEKQHVHTEEELNFQEDHFGTGSVLEGTAHRWNSAKNTYDRSNEHKVRESPLKVCVRDVHIIWNLFDGYDWQHTRDTITKAVREVESKAIEKRSRSDHRPTFEQDIDDEETVIGDFLFNSIYIGIPGNRDPAELANAINQELNDNATETESIATTALTATPSRQGSKSKQRENRLRLNRSKHHKITFELKGVNVDFVAFPPGSGETQSSIDLRVRDFDIYDHVPTSTWKKFATYMHDAGERESGASQIHLEILSVKPIPELAASEIVLKATVLPLRLHVDQDALDFITRFFEFKDDSGPATSSKSEPPFLQRVEVNSIPVKLDFKPKRVDYKGLRSGHTTEFMNFIVLDEADMVLRHTIIYGISGFDKLGKCLNDIWMPDIKRNQLPGILAGLAPVRSIVNVGSGVRDLVVVPMREYRKDGRIVRSISKGAAAFARTTGTELIKFGAKLAIGTQTVLQGAEDFLVKPNESRDGGWEDADLDEDEKQISLYADQPIGVVQGLRGAYASLERDLVMARDAIIAVPGEVMDSTTAQGAARAVLRRAPTVILRPVIGASKAIGQTLMGATNSLDPQNLRRVQDKYKRY